MQRANTLLRTIAAKRAVPQKGYHSHGPVATYNDLPQPQGSWQVHNEAQQRKYNTHLFLGVAFSIFSLVVAKAGGFLYMNYTAPSEPAESNDYS